MRTITSNDVSVLAVTALERMAFAMAEPSQMDPVAALADTRFHATIEIGSDHGTGCVLLAATPGFLQEIASGMLGLEPDEIDLDDQGAVTIQELTNILGGQLILALGGEDESLRLALPITVAPAEAQRELEQCLREGFGCAVATDLGHMVIAGRWPPDFVAGKS